MTGEQRCSFMKQKTHTTTGEVPPLEQSTDLTPRTSDESDRSDASPDPRAVALALSDLAEALADPTIAARTAAYLAGDLPGTEAP